MVLAAWLLNVGNQSPGEPVKNVSGREDHESGHSIWRRDRSVLMAERFDLLSVQTFQLISDEGAQLTGREISILTSHLLLLRRLLLRQMLTLVSNVKRLSSLKVCFEKRSSVVLHPDTETLFK